ncbi:MAG: hypothetical protein ACXV5Q_05805, partial [Frankiaceae bacterium]
GGWGGVGGGGEVGVGVGLGVVVVEPPWRAGGAGNFAQPAASVSPRATAAPTVATRVSWERPEEPPGPGFLFDIPTSDATGQAAMPATGHQVVPSGMGLVDAALRRSELASACRQGVSKRPIG